MPQPPDPGQPRPPVERPGTLIETDEDIRQALLSRLKGQAQAPAQPAPPVPTDPAAQATGKGASAYRPTARPPLAILTVYDDGKLDGEVIRIRDPRFVIGRTEGNLTIPIDGRISSRHVEITHQVVGG